MDDAHTVQARSCSVNNCHEPVLAKGWCRRHYRQFKDTGRRCSSPGCGREHYAKGFCSRHYRTSGTVARWCSFPDCEGAHYGRGYCYRHYKRLKKHGDPGILLIRRGATRSYLAGEVGHIELTQGKWAVVDAADYPILNRFVWHAQKGKGTWYAASSGVGLMHTYLLNPSLGFVADHENQNGLDNRRRNLREATAVQNAQNIRRNPKNTSGYKGVHRHRETGKWVAQIVHRHNRHYLGLYADIKDAAEAYRQAAIRFGFVYIPPSPYAHAA